MHILGYRWQSSAVLLLLFGMLASAIGIFFMLFRPALLPEDIKYMGLIPGELNRLGPPFQSWLERVFTVLGGFALGSGILTMGLAATTFRTRSTVAFVAAACGGASSIGLMVAVNFMIDSDFKWLLLACAGVWLASLVTYGLEAFSS